MASVYSGFYVSFGSRDFPNGHPWDEPFGFDTNSTTPRYAYSLIDVKNYYQRPVQWLRNNPMNNSENSLFMIEGADDWDDIMEQDINSSDWTRVYKIIDCIYNNQLLYASPATVDDADGVNYGDEVFSGIVTNDFNVPLSDLEGFYIPRSLIFNTISTGRITLAQFKVNMSGNDLVTINVYFSPNYLIERGTHTIFAVYTYEDLDNNNEINSSEFNSQIISRLHDILKKGKYKRYDTLSTRHVIDPTQTEAGYTVLQDFYIFSNLAESASITDETKKNAVRAYLEQKHYDAQEGDLHRWYPDLYMANVVSIRPFYNVNAEVVGGVTTVMHAFDSESYEHMKNISGITRPNGTEKRFEVFYVGASAVNNYQFRWPILAIEESVTSSVKRPISTRFPNYIPKWGYTTENLETDADKFHFFLMTALNKLNVNNNMTYDEQYASIFSDHLDDPHPHIIINFRNVAWVVYGAIN